MMDAATAGIAMAAVTTRLSQEFKSKAEPKLGGEHFPGTGSVFHAVSPLRQDRTGYTVA